MSGNFDGTFSGHPFTLRINWSESSPDPVGDTSVVSWNVQIIKTGNYTPYNNSASTVYFNIAGVAYSGTYTYNFNGAIGQTITILSGSTTVAHNPDGTGSAAMSASTNAGATLGSAGSSGTATLATIARASTPTFEQPSGTTVTSADAGTSVNVNMNRADSSFTHDITYSIGSVSNASLATGVGANTAWTIPTTLLNQIPSSASGLITFTTTTKNGSGTVIGTTTTTLTMTVPSSAVPTIGSITNSEATAGVASAIGAYVQSISTLALAIVGAAGVYGSTISSYELDVAGQTISASSGTTTPISASGTVTITAHVTDSRGKVGTLTQNVTVLAYSPPTNDPTIFQIRRSDASGTPNATSGTYLREDFSATVASLVVSGTQKNTLTYKIYVRTHGSGSYTLAKTVTPSGVTFNSYDIVGTYLLTSSYDVQVTVSDIFGAIATQAGTISTASVFMHWAGGGGGLGLGKYWSQGSLDAHAQMYQNEGQAVLDVSQAYTKAQVNALDRGRKNAIIDGNFRANQRGYVSAATLLPGAYGHDRWRGGGRMNLAFNPKAATAVTGWTNTSNTVAATQLTGLTISGLSGVTTAARWTCSSAIIDGIAFYGGSTSPFSLVTTASGHVGSLWVRSSVAKTVTLNLQFLNSAGAQISLVASAPVALVANVWTLLTVSAATPAGSVKVSLLTLSTTAWAVGNTLDATGAVIEAGTAILPYFDGASSGASWTGSANASASISQASCTYTYTSAPQGQTVTVTAGSISQVIERANVAALTYTLSWVGTATGRVYNRSATTIPAYSASSSTWALDGTDDVVVEFSTGTLGNVQLEIGSVATAYEYIPIAEELALCEFYYKRYSGQGQYWYVGPMGLQQNTTTATFFVPGAMRAMPTLSWGNICWASSGANTTPIGSLSISTNFGNLTLGIWLSIAWSGAVGAQGQGGYCVVFAATGIGYFDMNADF